MLSTATEAIGKKVHVTRKGSPVYDKTGTVVQECVGGEFNGCLVCNFGTGSVHTLVHPGDYTFVEE